MKIAAIFGGVILLALLVYGVKSALDWFHRASKALEGEE